MAVFIVVMGAACFGESANLSKAAGLILAVAAIGLLSL